MVHANPGLRPGLSSAVPPGLDFVMVVLTQTLKPSSARPSAARLKLSSRALRAETFPELVTPLLWLNACPSFINTRENSKTVGMREVEAS